MPHNYTTLSPSEFETPGGVAAGSAQRAAKNAGPETTAQLVLSGNSANARKLKRAFNTLYPAINNRVAA